MGTVVVLAFGLLPWLEQIACHSHLSTDRSL
jgi:hypothetical protein